jgi:hypothetical protein
VNNTSQKDFNRVNDVLQLWKERIAFLEREQAIVASSTEQFELRKRIEECRAKIYELEARISDGT